MDRLDIETREMERQRESNGCKMARVELGTDDPR